MHHIGCVSKPLAVTKLNSNPFFVPLPQVLDVMFRSAVFGVCVAFRSAVLGICIILGMFLSMGKYQD